MSKQKSWKQYAKSRAFGLPLVKTANCMKVYDITKEIELESKWGVPYEGARTWYWKSINDHYIETGNTGSLRAITEMEALDRLREAFPDIGRIKWIPKSEYYSLLNDK